MLSGQSIIDKGKETMEGNNAILEDDGDEADNN